MLSLNTGLALSELETWDERAIATAWELIEEAEERAKER